MLKRGIICEGEEGVRVRVRVRGDVSNREELGAVHLSMVMSMDERRGRKC